MPAFSIEVCLVQRIGVLLFQVGVSPFVRTWVIIFVCVCVCLSVCGKLLMNLDETLWICIGLVSEEVIPFWEKLSRPVVRCGQVWSAKCLISSIVTMHACNSETN